MLVSEFAENLAYDVQKQFGDDFKTWLSEDRNRNKGTEAKVISITLYFSFISHFLVTPRHANGLACGKITWEKMPTLTNSSPF